MGEWLRSLGEGTIIGMTFAFCYCIVAIFIGLYMLFSDRENEKYWERLYGKSDKKGKLKKMMR